jgi:hypothetical protein
VTANTIHLDAGTTTAEQLPNAAGIRLTDTAGNTVVLHGPELTALAGRIVGLAARIAIHAASAPSSHEDLAEHSARVRAAETTARVRGRRWGRR